MKPFLILQSPSYVVQHKPVHLQARSAHAIELNPHPFVQIVKDQLLWELSTRFSPSLSFIHRGLAVALNPTRIQQPFGLQWLLTLFDSSSPLFLMSVLYQKFRDLSRPSGLFSHFLEKFFCLSLCLVVVSYTGIILLLSALINPCRHLFRKEFQSFPKLT